MCTQPDRPQNGSINTTSREFSITLILPVDTAYSMVAMSAIQRWGHMEVMCRSSFNSLRDIIVSGFRLGAFNPRDHVFAFLGLAKDLKNLDIEPDCRKTYEEVCVDTAWRLLRQRNLELLQYAHGLCSTPLANTLPLWVPEWSLRMASVLHAPRFPGDFEFSAGGFSAKRLTLGEIDFASGALQVPGTVVGKVVEVGWRASFSTPRTVMKNFNAAMNFLFGL
jgi:hypothetical protein